MHMKYLFWNICKVQKDFYYPFYICIYINHNQSSKSFIRNYLKEDKDGFSTGRLLRRERRGNQNPYPSFPSQSRILPSEHTRVKNSNTIAILSGSVMHNPPKNNYYNFVYKNYKNHNFLKIQLP